MCALLGDGKGGAAPLSRERVRVMELAAGSVIVRFELLDEGEGASADELVAMLLEHHELGTLARGRVLSKLDPLAPPAVEASYVMHSQSKYDGPDGEPTTPAAVAGPAESTTDILGAQSYPAESTADILGAQS